MNPERIGIIPFLSRVILTSVLLLAIAEAMSLMASDQRLEWDRNTETNITYRVYWGGASRSYTNFVQTTNTTATISNLNDGVVYFVAVTARDTNGLESSFSDEVSFVKPNPPTKLRLSVNIQSVLNLGDEWEDGPHFVTFEFPAMEQRFYRASVATRIEPDAPVLSSP